MVMPYMRKGNVREYLEANPNIDRLKIVRLFYPPSLAAFTDALGYSQLHDISLGLVHLHSQQIVHGDIKAVCLR